MAPKTCVKCGHVNPAPSGAADEACPACGVIYAKAQASAGRPVTAAVQARRAAAETVSGFGSSGGRASGFGARRAALAPANEAANLRAAWVEDMRGASLYPTFRAFVRFGYIAGCIVAALLAAGAVLSLFTSAQGLLVFLIGAGSAAMVWLFSRVAKEFSLMVADLSDALVRMAAHNEEK